MPARTPAPDRHRHRLELSGADADDYVLSDDSHQQCRHHPGHGDAVVTADDKVYDGTTTATLSSQGVDGVLGDDDVTLDVTAADFASKDVGTGITVTASGLSLRADAGDYVLSDDSASSSADITPATPTVQVTDAGGFAGQPATATATVAGVVATGPNQDNTPASSLEGVDLTLSYYAGSTATGTPLADAPSTVGTYAVVASFPGSQNYLSGSDSVTFTISWPPLQGTGQIVSDAANSQLVTLDEATIDVNQGALRLSQPLDFDQSPGSSVGGGPALVYNSATVNVRPILQLSFPGDASLPAPTQATVDLVLRWRRSGPRDLQPGLPAGRQRLPAGCADQPADHDLGPG